MQVDGAATASEIAQRLSVGLVVVGDGAVEWCNAAAQALVEAHGGSWTADGAPVRLLTGVPPGAVRRSVRWSPPAGGQRLWEVTRTPLTPPRVLFEVVELPAPVNGARPIGMAEPHWRLDRLEALARMGSWVWHVADGRLEWSEALLAMFGRPVGEVLDFDAFRALVHPDDLAMIDAAIAEGMTTGLPFTYTHRMVVGGAVERIFECHGEVFRGADGRPLRVLGTARDVTEEHRARTELAYLAEHDPLTGIANRRGITARLARCAADPAGATLLLLDVDHFKDVNDLRGHAVGDRVIRRVAETVAARLGAGALLGRLGGDELAAVLPGCDPAAGIALAERLCDAVAGEAVLVEGQSAVRVTVSVGVVAVECGDGVEASLARADLALYAAKDAGRNRARLFAPDQYRQAVARVGVLQRVGDALDEGTMELDAQPIVELATGHPGRSELLIRLRDGLAPVLGPAEFLPAAERTDLVLRLDRWVLARAVRTLAEPAARARDLRLEVNVSARSLEDDDLGAWVLAQLRERSVEPHRLGLEITETTAITNLDAAKRLVGQLTGAGCGFSLDDFGAGFGSFSHLKHLPFTAVKIAGEFVRHLDTDPVDRALVSAVVGVAQRLGMRTVAEQVDRPELVDVLRELGVDDGQGFHLGRPRPLDGLFG
ncbi:putative bifunctional diguanylate cyclase/phosphodiesterase [Pseudonocardia lacus]|uniref:putative bifunctional diguanylate cyclase/phosphodiesterase n=1 Tax=Pseudonocardia lacus TaxID=2835865 RepID=UPI001BDC8B04|nr:PAS domain-containing protein [Pseudonocardia lacus]